MEAPSLIFRILLTPHPLPFLHDPFTSAEEPRGVITGMSTLTPLPPLDLVPVWEQALSYESFVAAASEDHRPLWEAIGRTHAPSEASLELRLPEGSRLLVIAADWCGDAVNVIPALHNWAVATGVEMRLIERDSGPG